MILLIHVQLVICRSQQLFSLLQNYLFLICLCAVEYFCIKEKSFSHCHGFFSSETFCPYAKMNFNLKPVLRSAPPPQLYVASRLKYSISVCIILEQFSSEGCLCKPLLQLLSEGVYCARSSTYPYRSRHNALYLACDPLKYSGNSFLPFPCTCLTRLCFTTLVSLSLLLSEKDISPCR